MIFTPRKVSIIAVCMLLLSGCDLGKNAKIHEEYVETSEWTKEGQSKGFKFKWTLDLDS